MMQTLIRVPFESSWDDDVVFVYHCGNVKKARTVCIVTAEVELFYEFSLRKGMYLRRAASED